MRYASFLFAIFFVISCATQGNSSVEMLQNIDELPLGILPAGVQPTAYRLSFQIDPEQERYTGVVEIDVTLNQGRRAIFLHGKGLSVDSAGYQVRAQDGFQPLKYAQVDESGVVRLSVDSGFMAGSGILRFEYSAAFNKDLESIYRVKVGDGHAIYTQMEPISARLGFPGFDEPRFKTPFEMTLEVPEGLVALANGPEVARVKVKVGERTFDRVSFQKTLPLPTYLVALAVGDFDVVEGQTMPPSSIRKHALPFRAIAPKGQGKNLKYALENTTAFVSYFENYFGVAYPYAKLDVIAVPDFSSGAMENAGLITFRDYLLLIDESTATRNQKRWFAYVMAHELAHQWFGNLVTMPWWDDIWLNEAFASWLEYDAMVAVMPQAKSKVDQREDAFRIMNSDALASARQIRQPVESNHDIHNAFDGITYSKGAAVLAMFEGYLGKEVFRTGVSNYLKNREFQTGTADDLIGELVAVAPEMRVKEAMESYLLQAGVPELMVKSTCSEDSAHLELSQRRYFPLGSTLGTENTQQWSIPACFKYEDKAGGIFEECALVGPETSRVSLKACPSFVHPNANGAGYYRFTLDKDGFAALASSFDKLTLAEKLSVGDAVGAAFNAGKIEVSELLRMAKKFAGESERALVEMPMSWLSFLRNRVLKGGERSGVEAFTRELYAAHYKKLGVDPIDGESDDAVNLRSNVLSTLVHIGQDSKVRTELAQRGRKLLDTPFSEMSSVVAPDLAGLALSVVSEMESKGVLKKEMEALASATVPTERRVLLAGLGAVKGEEALSQAQTFLLQSDALRSNEILRLMRSLAQHEEQREPMWRWLTQNYDTIVKRVPESDAARMVYTVGFCDAAQASAAEAFFADKVESMPGGPRSLRKYAESVRLCSAKASAHRESALKAF